MKKILSALFVSLFFASAGLAGSGDGGKIDVQNYDVSIDLRQCLVSPYPKSYKAKAVIKIKALQELSSIELDARNFSLIIDEVTGNATKFTHYRNLLKVELDRSYSEGEEFALTVEYRHKDVFDSAFYCFDGIVYTDCETAGARRWLPCNDVPYDKALLTLRAVVPEDVQFCSNGILRDSTVRNGRVTYSYESIHPISTYLIAFVASEKYMLTLQDWDYADRGRGSMQVRYYYQRGETMFNLRNILQKTGRMLDFFSETYCDYPFEKLAFATTDRHFPWGGMENQTLVTLCPDCWIEDLVCHELVHQWFGDMITPQTWADIWLNEGFATYNEALWFEKAYGNKRYMESVQAEAVKYLGSNAGWAIYNQKWDTEEPNDTEVFESSITYSKASCVLYMLRYVLGDAKFFDALKKYANDGRFRYGNVNTRQFIDFLEETTDTELDWFFDQWIFGPNHPVYSPAVTIERSSDGKWRAEYMITQNQTNAGFFRMPVEFEVTYRDGSSERIKEQNSYNMQVFEYTFDKEPAGIRFDPDNRIILKEVR
ncbi:MAG: M1 family metallopeptidase [Ignavibacteria bacterium]|nr:M1 family metallopeptidase [Ignavibacteria bacterium]